MKQISYYIFLTSRWQGAPYFELMSEPAISLQKGWEGATVERLVPTFMLIDGSTNELLCFLVV